MHRIKDIKTDVENAEWLLFEDGWWYVAKYYKHTSLLSIAQFEAAEQAKQSPFKVKQWVRIAATGKIKQIKRFKKDEVGNIELHHCPIILTDGTVSSIDNTTPATYPEIEAHFSWTDKDGDTWLLKWGEGQRLIRYKNGREHRNLFNHEIVALLETLMDETNHSIMPYIEGLA